MRGIIFYQNIVREKDVVKEIMKLFRSKEIEIKAYSIDFEYMKAVTENKKCKEDFIIMPWMYSEENYVLMSPFIRKNPKIIIVNLHSEQISSENSNKLLMPRTDHAKDSVLHFVWGKHFYMMLRDIGIDEKKIYVTGNTRTDFAFAIKKYDRKYLSEKYGLDIKKKWILYSENRDIVYSLNEKYKQERLNAGITEQEYEGEFNAFKESLKATFKDIHGLDDSFYDKYELIYRSHPGCILPSRLDCRAKAITDLSIYDWLYNVDMNVVWGSTTAFESDLMGVATVLHMTTENISRYLPTGVCRYPKIKSLNEIDDSVFIEAKNKNIFKDYLGLCDGKSCERTVKIILQLLKKPIEDYKATFVPFPIKRRIKLQVYEWLTTLFSRIGLLLVLKYPRTAFSSYRNIPWIYAKDIL